VEFHIRNGDQGILWDSKVAGYLFCILPGFYDSKLIFRPNLAYNSTFKCDISSLIVPSFSSNDVTSSSIFSVDEESSSWTSDSGREMKESPILYLAGVRIQPTAAVYKAYTVFCRLRLPIRARSIYHRGLLSPSAGDTVSCA